MRSKGHHGSPLRLRQRAGGFKGHNRAKVRDKDGTWWLSPGAAMKLARCGHKTLHNWSVRCPWLGGGAIRKRPFLVASRWVTYFSLDDLTTAVAAANRGTPDRLTLPEAEKTYGLGERLRKDLAKRSPKLYGRNTLGHARRRRMLNAAEAEALAREAKQPIPADRLTIPEAARDCGVSIGTIRSWIGPKGCRYLDGRRLTVFKQKYPRRRSISLLSRTEIDLVRSRMVKPGLPFKTAAGNWWPETEAKRRWPRARDHVALRRCRKQRFPWNSPGHSSVNAYLESDIEAIPNRAADGYFHPNRREHIDDQGRRCWPIAEAKKISERDDAELRRLRILKQVGAKQIKNPDKRHRRRYPKIWVYLEEDLLRLSTPTPQPSASTQAQAPAATPPASAPNMDEFLTSVEVFTRHLQPYGVNRGTWDTRLTRWKAKHHPHDSDCREFSNRSARAPQFQYRLGAVWPVIVALQGQCKTGKKDAT